MKKKKNSVNLTDQQIAQKISDEIIAAFPISTHVDFGTGIQTSIYKDGRVVTEPIDNNRFKFEIKKMLED